MESRIWEARYRRTIPDALLLAADLGISATRDDIAPSRVAYTLWEAFKSRVHSPGVGTRTWPPTGWDNLAAYLAELAAKCDLSAVWMLRFDDMIVGVRVPSTTLVTDAARSIVSAERDLILLTDDASDALVVGFNHLPTRDEFELIAWGCFSDPPSSDSAS